MGFHFRRSFKILPGVRLNVSKSGVSTSVGVRGAHVTFGQRNTRGTVGIPGTGLSYSERLDAPSRPSHDGSGFERKPVASPTFIAIVVFMAVTFFLLFFH